MQPGDFSGTQVEFAQTLAPLIAGFFRAHCADIKRIGLQRLQQGHIVQLGIVRDGDDHGMRIGLESDDRIIRHAVNKGRAGHPPCGAVLLARIADEYLKIQGGRNLGQIARDFRCADDQQTPARTMNTDELIAVTQGLIGRRGRPVTPLPRAQVDDAGKHLACGNLAEQLVKPGN